MLRLGLNRVTAYQKLGLNEEGFAIVKDMVLPENVAQQRKQWQVG